MCSILDRLVRLIRPKSGRSTSGKEDNYWQSRRKMRYYSEVLRLARKYAPAAESVLDVGPNGTPLVCELNWIASKTVIDLCAKPIAGATCLQGDFLQYEPAEPFDLVLCLQVLEHIRPAGEFAQRLLAAGRLVIVSVPYRWPAGSCKHHVQDPVDEDKLRGWMQQPFLEHRIIRDGARDRLIAVLAGKAAAQAASQRGAA
jgi:Methyltransferase domain